MSGNERLSLELQFRLRTLYKNIEELSEEQAKDYLRETFKQMMIKDNIMRKLLMDGMIPNE